MNEQKFNEILSNIEKMNCSDNHKKYLVALITEFNDFDVNSDWPMSRLTLTRLMDYIKFCYEHYRHDISAKLNIQLVIDMLRNVDLHYLANQLDHYSRNFTKR